MVLVASENKIVRNEMKKNNEYTNVNNFNGQMNFNGSTQIATGDIINNVYCDDSIDEYTKASYTPEPVWRSPFTMAVLTWISVVKGILGLIPFTTIIRIGFGGRRGNINEVSSNGIQVYVIVFAISALLLICLISLRGIVKKQIRVPIGLNYAFSGYGGRITLEKIYIDKCPICAGQMKYYNKPVEWIDRHYSDGKTKREVTKRVPALECKRNHEHCYAVDPAADKLSD